MALTQYMSFFIALSLLAIAPTSLSSKTRGGYLYPQFYDHSCPKAQKIVYSTVAKAVAKETRTAASLIRLHFHDCFVKRLYNQTGNGLPDSSLHPSYAAQLRTRCPRSGGDQNLFFLDFVSPTKFDNSYFKNLLASKGLLSSDQVLVTKNEASMELVKKYAENNELFFEQFAKSMVKMGNISPLIGFWGEIRKNCRKVNS
ncbi:class III peroxidase [Tripterygium wilfordii]|uniref:peroxidase n=1 Tax=Tripterygium wilfordii TaxID=458696 RepID=A0A7J7CPI5_TRIWF|nr:class III peroxidase [Tripterygium wilfordii]